jgi:hypothetical protein
MSVRLVILGILIPFLNVAVGVSLIDFFQLQITAQGNEWRAGILLNASANFAPLCRPHLHQSRKCITLDADRTF